MEWIETVVISTALMYMMGFGYLFNHFSALFAQQLDVTDKILAKLFKKHTKTESEVDEDENQLLLTDFDITGNEIMQPPFEHSLWEDEGGAIVESLDE